MQQYKILHFGFQLYSKNITIQSDRSTGNRVEARVIKTKLRWKVKKDLEVSEEAWK